MSEAARLECLRDLALDRIENPQLFSSITRLAAQMSGCRIALVSIVDEDRQWFLGRTGFDQNETARSVSLCSVCIAGGQPLLISDARLDDRFRDNPLVTGGPKLRSYLGVPIAAEDGCLLGTLCVISPEPGAFTKDTLPALQSLAQLAEQGILAHGRAIELRRANTSLEELNRLFKQAETAANIGSWRVDLATDELRWSSQVYAIHGLDPANPIDVGTAIGFYAPQDRPLVRRALTKTMNSAVPFSFEAEIERADGQKRRIRSVGERIDIDGRADAVAGVVLDCTEEHLKNAALQRAAERDRLTGLYNRAVFDARLAAALHRAGTACATVMLLDLDGFKEVNDALGHLVGDKLLANLADRLVRHCGDEVFVARWGGDEFAFLFPESALLSEAVQFGEKLTRELTEEIVIADQTLCLGATCGIAQGTRDVTPEEIIRRADLALYHGKAEGRGTVHCWSQGIEGTQAARQHAIAEVTSALCDGRAYAAYQPIVELETGRMVSVEALLRLRDTAGRMITASEVFPAFLDPVMSRKVSRFMLRQVLQEGAAILERFGPDCRVGINVSEADLRSRSAETDFVTQITALLDDSVLEPRNIVLEVTETMLLLDDNGHVRDTLTRLAQLGFTIALDDFGTGFSSLTHLRDFPIGKVKIDKDFIAAIVSDHQSRLIIQAIVQMSHSLGLRVVAEGVETAEQESFLAAIGCSHAQGFRYGRPKSLGEWNAQMRDAGKEPEGTGITRAA